MRASRRRRTHGAEQNAEQAFILEERWQLPARSQRGEVAREGGEFAVVKLPRAMYCACCGAARTQHLPSAAGNDRGERWVLMNVPQGWMGLFISILIFAC